MWQNYLNAFLGLCVLAVAFMATLSVAMTWTLAVLGLLVLLFGLWGGAATTTYSEREHRHA